MHPCVEMVLFFGDVVNVSVFATEELSAEWRSGCGRGFVPRSATPGGHANHPEHGLAEKEAKRELLNPSYALAASIAFCTRAFG